METPPIPGAPAIKIAAIPTVDVYKDGPYYP